MTLNSKRRANALFAEHTDAFTIMQVAGHSAVTVSQRYVHPSPETIERAFERLERLNSGQTESPLEGPKRLPPATVVATSDAVQ